MRTSQLLGRGVLCPVEPPGRRRTGEAFAEALAANRLEAHMSPMRDVTPCHRCGALVASVSAHLAWHVELEGLEEPTGEIGFWDPQGHWVDDAANW